MKENLISYFNGPISYIIPSETKTLADIYTLIKLSFKELTEQVRNGRVSKITLPYVTPSGTFSSRKDSDLLTYSSIVCIDLDKCNIEVKTTLCNDAFLNPALVFVSPSGNGLKVFIAINNAKIEDHFKYFTAISQYIFETYELESDKACKDVSRACFLCHDPEVYYSKGSIDSEKLLEIIKVPLQPELLQREVALKLQPTMAVIPEKYQQPSEQLNRLALIHERAVSSLILNGWQQNGENWTRPGKDPKDGNSAIFNEDPKDRLYKFTNYSVNGHPFQLKGYTDVQVICELEFSGDFKSCIQELSKEYFSFEILPKKPDNRAKINPLPIEGMPLFIREFIKACAETYNTPPDFWAGAAIMATALGIGDKIVLVGQYENVPNLWMNIIGDVSSGKTEAINFTLKPFEDLDSIAVDQYRKAFEEYEAIATMSAKERQEAGIDQLTKPTCKQYLLKDSTPEALMLVHSINQRGLMIARDELKGWLDDFNRYSKSGEQSNMLSSFNRIPMVTNRKGGGKDSVIRISKPCILVFGGMQPDLLPTLANDNRAENGFLARFCNVWPDEARKPNYNSTTVPEELKMRWKEYITALTEIEQQITIKLSKESEKIYQVWFDKNAEISNYEESGYLKGVYGKLDIIALRIAIVIYGMHMYDTGEITQVVSAEQMNAAIGITEYFRATALKVYRKIFGTKEIKMKKSEVIKWTAENMEKSVSEVAKFFDTSRSQVDRILKKTIP